MAAGGRRLSMRVLLVDLDRNWRGGQEQALLLLEGLRARGHNAELIATQHAPLAKRAAEAQIPVHTVSGKARRWGAAWMVSRLLRRRRFEVVHVNEPHALFAAWVARAHRHAALVIARRVAIPVPRNRISLIRYRAAARLVAISQVVREDLLAARLDPPGVDVVADGVKLPPPISSEERRRARERWNFSPDGRVLSFVASLTKEKGHALLLEAFGALRQQAPCSRLLLAGGGPLRAQLERQAREAGLGDSVIFAGFVEDVRSIHAASDLFVFPALNEGAGSALLSAMACGLPVVALARGGVREIVDDGRNGLLIENVTAPSFASAVLRLLGDAELAQRLARAGQLTVAERFSADRMVEDTLMIFQRLARCDVPSAERAMV